MVLKCAHQKRPHSGRGDRSLPETIGEQRNWDYRFCWLRDASMTINILTASITMSHVGLGFILILCRSGRKNSDSYSIHPRRKVVEYIALVVGIRKLKPSRGQCRRQTKQNDVYGADGCDLSKPGSVQQHPDNKEELWTVVRTLPRRPEQLAQPDSHLGVSHRTPALYVFQNFMLRRWIVPPASRLFWINCPKP